MSERKSNRARQRNRYRPSRGLTVPHKLEETIRDAYKNGLTDFSFAYSRWVQVRRGTLRNLENLVEELHDKQLDYNKTQCALKEVGFDFRTAPRTDTVLDGVVTFFDFLSIAASGIASIAEACDTDSYQKKFQEIMLPDSQATKRFYGVRSRCVKKYQDIEEVVRNFQPNTFDSVVDTVSTALKTEKFAIAVSGSDDASRMMAAIDEFISNSLGIETLCTVGGSIGNYVDENPAVLNACISGARVAMGVSNTFLDNKKESSELRRGVYSVTNHLMIRSDGREINRLHSVINQDLSQSKLENKIRVSIDNLQSELDDVVEAYCSLTLCD